MDDITALAQREKFESWLEGAEALPWGYLKKRRTSDDAYHEPNTTDMWGAWQAASAEMVEALEAEQQKSAKQGRHACELFDEVKQLQEQLRTVELSNSVLESRTVTVKLPDEINVLLNHLEDVIPQEVFKRIDVGVWNAVSRLSATGIQVIEGEGQ